MQLIPWALVLALANAGRSMPARIAMIAITTSNSMRVKPCRPGWDGEDRTLKFGFIFDMAIYFRFRTLPPDSKLLFRRSVVQGALLLRGVYFKLIISLRSRPARVFSGQGN